MKIFVTGATGVLGRGAVRELAAAGHQVAGVARSPAKAALLRSLGAVPVSVDLFDPPALRGALAGFDAVVHLATSIPPVSRAAKRGAWETNDRLRRDATRALVDAALAAGVKTFVSESIAFAYAAAGDSWLDENAPLAVTGATQSVVDLERETRRFGESEGATAIVLRFGLFYGPEARSTEEALLAARLGFSPALGAPDAYQASIHTDDAARAVAAALRCPPGTYNIVDDEPLTKRAYTDAFARAFGFRRLATLPKAVVRRAGGGGAEVLMRSQRVSNATFRAATGWAPRLPDAATGWEAVAAARSAAASSSPSPGTATRIGLAVLAITGLQLGMWAAFAPRAFYDRFPTASHAWVATDGPYNEHLIRDFGALNLALAMVAIVALVAMTRAAVVATGAAWLVYGVPHTVYHLRHESTFSGIDKLAAPGGIAATTVIAALVIVAALRSRAPVVRPPEPVVRPPEPAAAAAAG